jgi:hypothetical protein
MSRSNLCNSRSSFFELLEAGVAQEGDQRTEREAASPGQLCSESVRKVYAPEQIFLTIRRIEARWINAKAFRVRFSKSFASLRHLPSHENVRSTTHLRGMTSRALRVSEALDDLGDQERQNLLLRRPELRSLIAAVGEELAQKRMQSEHCRQHQFAAVAILNIGGMHIRMQQQTYRIDEDMALLALDRFSRVVAVKIDTTPPFAALLTLSLSIRRLSGRLHAPSPRGTSHRARDGQLSL